MATAAPILEMISRNLDQADLNRVVIKPWGPNRKLKDLKIYWKFKD